MLPSKATAVYNDYPVNSKSDIKILINDLNIDLNLLYEKWVATHLESVFCENSKLHAYRITNALIFLKFQNEL